MDYGHAATKAGSTSLADTRMVQSDAIWTRVQGQVQDKKAQLNFSENSPQSTWPRTDPEGKVGV